MTLLSIANAVADETHGPRPATIAGNTDPDAQNMLQLINKVGKRLMRIYPWNELRKEQTFTSIAAETQTGAIPTDFDRFVAETCWNRASNNLISGPISPVEWNGLKTQTYNSNTQKFIYRGGAFSTTPALDAGSTIAYEYIMKNWATDTTGATPKAAMSVDTDLSLLDDDLIIAFVKFEWLKDQGQPYQDAQRDAKMALDMLTGNDAATSNIAVVGDIFAKDTRHFDGTPKTSRTNSGGYY